MGYLGMLYDPLCKLSGSGAGLQIGLASVERVFEVLDGTSEIIERSDALPLARRARTLTLEQVGFQYSPGRQILHGLNARIEPGEMVAFVGPSGAGKSTLLNLLPRFYDVSQGAIKLDGHDIRNVKLRDLRKQVAIVSQESIMLPTTIAENIAYGRAGAMLSEIQSAAALAGASGFIEELPAQYATMLNEGGQNLSGGQRQRIAIARALLTESPFIVLDEPTSALDPLNEQLVTEMLERLKGRRTVLLVTHRLSSVVHCDQIFVLHQGRIVEQGTHEELLMAEGHYAAMANRQGMRQCEFAPVAS
jgi:ABC-type multidrug transport system fused ATPase/permease subunit